MTGPGHDIPLVLYDGDCGFCHGSVRFLLRHERDDRIRFAALNSPTGRQALAGHGLNPKFAKSVVFIENGHAYLWSTAVLRLAAHLRFPWRLLALGGYVPRPLRDAAYRLVARYRGLLAGKVRHCELPEPQQSQRFIDNGC